MTVGDPSTAAKRRGRKQLASSTGLALPIDVRSAIDRECRIAELVHHNPALRFTTERPHPIVTMVMRDRFDHLLISAAQARGITLAAGTTVTSVRVEHDGVVLATSGGDVRARFVIAADGVNSPTARALNLPALEGVVPALECEATFPADVMERFEGRARFDFGLVPAGYGWVFPKNTHLSVGVGTTHRGAVNLHRAYDDYVQALGLGTPVHEERRGYMIPCRPRRRLFDTPRVLLAGDAAGLADPVTAEGITAGIVSGQLAARAIVAGDFNDAVVRRAYRGNLQSELLGDLRVARRLAWLLYDRPRWGAALLSRHGHGMSELMTRIVTGETTYRAAVLRPSHYIRLLRGRS